MFRSPLVLILLFISVASFGQKKSNIHCERIEQLLSQSDFKEAYKQLVVNGEYSCGTITYAKVLKWNGRYQEALELLKGVESNEAQQLREELEEIVSPELPDELYSIRPYDENDSISRRIIGFDTAPIFVTSKTLETQLFPVRKYEEQLILSTSSDSSALFDHIEAEIYGKQEKVELDLTGGWIASDSIFYYSAHYKVPIYSEGFHNNHGIYILDGKGSTLAPWTEKKTAYFHPTVMHEKWLIFSSNLAGGYGGLDLWKVDLTNPESEPINLGSAVNSVGNEIYPTAAGDSLYYASDDSTRSMGGYDIFLFAEGVSSNPGKPLNSSNDELNPYAVNRQLDFVLTDRLYPDSLDFVMKVKPFKQNLLFNLIHGEVAEGSLEAGERVDLLDENGRLLDYTYVNQDGRFTFTSIKGLETYSISVSDNKLSEGDRLSIFNENYQLIEELEVDGEGMARFELLTPEDYVLQKVSNSDESILSLDIEGLYSDRSGKTKQGVEIFLQDSEGYTIARAYTDSSGKFVFEQVIPDESYSFQSSVKNVDSEIRIFNQKGEIIEVIRPEPGGNFVYVRLKESDRIITFTNDQQVSMRVAEEESFNLPAMYFQLNDDKIVEESKSVLINLEKILEQNEHVSIKLSGHTDSKGKASYNLDLSKRRVKTIKDYLVVNGISESRIKGEGYGETRLVNECSDGLSCTEEQHAENRRIEIQFFITQKP
jgi:outer membrane protein OmpA-like peptidoglycan-associated protein